MYCMNYFCLLFIISLLITVNGRINVHFRSHKQLTQPNWISIVSLRETADSPMQVSALSYWISVFWISGETMTSAYELNSAKQTYVRILFSPPINSECSQSPGCKKSSLICLKLPKSLGICQACIESVWLGPFGWNHFISILLG